MLTTIPFSGFYNTIHDEQLNHELEQIVSDSRGCGPISRRLADEIWDGINMRDAMQEYAKRYADAVAQLEDESFEDQIVEDMACNGDVSNMIYNALNENGKRIAKIADYLRERSERQYKRAS